MPPGAVTFRIAADCKVRDDVLVLNTIPSEHIDIVAKGKAHVSMELLPPKDPMSNPQLIHE
jgi:hypothetical protein